MSALAAANHRLIPRYGRQVKLRRESLRAEITITATSRKYKPEELIGSQQQNTLEFRILDKDVRDTILCFPQKYDRIIDEEQILSVENAEPIHLRGELLAWAIKVTG